MTERINHHRRRLFGAAAVTIAAAQLGLAGRANAQPVRPGANSAFAALKQTDAGVLSVGYAETGPQDGPAVLLLHGWPYDIHS